MILVINVDALDKTVAAVVSISDLSPLGDVQNLTLGNVEPLTISFIDSSYAVPAWVTDSTTALAVGIGIPDINGALNYSSTTSFSISGTTRVGTLSLNTALLRAAMYRPWPIGGQPASGAIQAAYGLPVPGASMFTLEIRRTTAAGVIQTLALLPVFVLPSELPANPDTVSAALPYGIVPLPSIAALTGGGATALDGVEDLSPALPTGYTVLLSYGRIPQIWQIFAGTDATNVSATPAIVRVKNYDSSTDARVWVQLM